MEPAHDLQGGPACVAAADPHARSVPVLDDPEPRWPAIVAALCTTGLIYALPPALSIGPRWLLFSIVFTMLVPTIALHQAGHHRLNTILGHIIAGTMTGFMIWSVVRLVQSLVYTKSGHHLEAIDLLHAAVFLWTTNVLVFGLWYWRLDAGGPNARDLRVGHPCGSFLFPQMTLQEDYEKALRGKPWAPQFADYLFLAFNTSTALSPTDTAVLSRWAKLLMMLQSAISLTIIVLLAARAVNILQ